MRFWVWLFLLAAGLEVLTGAAAWPGVLSGHLDDPDSYMRLERIYQGVRAGHLTNFVARDQSGGGVLVEWSRLLDAVIWALAAPLALLVGWHRALFVAGVVLGPLGAGGLAVCLAYAAEPFVARRFLWVLPFAATVLPALHNYGVPGVATHHVLLVALIALTFGLMARAWEGDNGYGFLAGVAGGFAIWLTPETMPFVLLCFGALWLRWLQARMGAVLAACGAGFVDVLGFGFAIDPPAGGYGVAEIDRLSVVFVALGLAVFLGGMLCWRLERVGNRNLARAAGIGGAVLLLGAWLAVFPGILRGPYGLLSPADAKLFFGAITEMRPMAPDATSFAYLWPGFLALIMVVAMACRGRDWRWWYAVGVVALMVVLGVKFVRFAPFSSAAAGVLLAMALQFVSARYVDRPAAVFGRVALLASMFLVPYLPALAAKPAPAGAMPVGSCDLRGFAPALGAARGAVVLADVNETPELLWRSDVETVGSLYHHGIGGFLTLRAAWRAPADGVEPVAVAATGARYVLFCGGAGRTLLVADLPKTTLWDALLAGTPPAWLEIQPGSAGSNWRLYRIANDHARD